MDAEKSHSYGRLPHPLKKPRSKSVFSVPVPKAGLLLAPHTSPPVAARFCAFGFFRSQSGMKLLLLSVHARAVVVAARRIGLSGVLPVGADTYLPRLTLSAVLPLPNTSYVAAYRPVTS